MRHNTTVYDRSWQFIATIPTSCESGNSYLTASDGSRWAHFRVATMGI